MFRNRTTVLSIPVFVLSAGLLSAQPQAFQDVSPTGPDGNFFGVIRIAQAVGLAVPASLGACVSTAPGTNPPIVPPSGATPQCPYFAPDTPITRAEAAYWIVKSLFDEAQITQYLCATGGDPSGLSPQCNAPNSASFGDLGVAGAAIKDPFVVPNPAMGIAGVTNAQLMRDIEVMKRRGYTKGCGANVDLSENFCPNDEVNRAQIAVLIIRAKLDQLYATSLSGIPGPPPADSFPVNPVPYFTDVTPGDPTWGPYFKYVQKLAELGITHGTTPTTFGPGNNITRKEIAAFVIKAFFL